MKKKELETKLNGILNMINEYLSTDPSMLVSTLELLNSLKTMITSKEEKPVKETIVGPSQGRVIISCDASIKKNPGGPSSVGVIIQHPGQKENLELSQFSKATTNNQAEYDAVYFGLMSLSNLSNNPGTIIEVRSDSKLVIDTITGIAKCRNEKLAQKRNYIIELVQTLPVPVVFEWRPRNSTPELKQANYLAQDLLQIPRH